MTVSILVLLALVAVGLLTLSTLTIRSGSLSSAEAEARANARLALTLALGNLQKHLGSDQRVTAPAAILDESPESAGSEGVSNPQWVGAWNSWAAGEERFGDDEPSDHRTVEGETNEGNHPTYEEHRADHFRSWLVSLPAETDGEDDPTSAIDFARSLTLDGSHLPATQADAVRLVGRGTLGDNAPQQDFVHAALRDVDTDNRSTTERNGRFAWWVADESAKARLLADRFELDDDLDNADLLARAQSAAATGHETIEALEGLDDPGQIQRIITRNSMELPLDGDTAVREAFHTVTPYSRGVLADVREGGLKQDLNALLERPIDPESPMHRLEDDDLLYAFKRRTVTGSGILEKVPVQDLAAFYQCYREVVKYDNNYSGNPVARSSMQINNVDYKEGYGFKREYSQIYRFPVPIKIQYVLSYVAQPRRPTRNNRDRFKLNMGITPALTLWNPYNTPLVLNHGRDESSEIRYFNMPFAITWTKQGSRGSYTSPRPTSLSWITNKDRNRWQRADGTGGNSERYTGFEIFYGGDTPVVMEPGEVRVFSLRKTSTGRSGNNYIGVTTTYRPEREVDPGWDPNFFLEMPRSDRNNNDQHIDREPKLFPNDPGDGGSLTFGPGDRISFTVSAADHGGLANGAALHFFCRQSSVVDRRITTDRPNDNRWMRRFYTLMSRQHTQRTANQLPGFQEDLISKGLPDGATELRFPAIRGSELANGAHRPFLLISMTMGCEVSKDTTGDARGRLFTQRPFLHSTPIQALAFVDRSDHDSFYMQPWNWWIQDINSVLEAAVQVDSNNINSFYGGGYTPDFGTTHCIQQEIPLTPLQSLGTLSHARLGGYSLANNMLAPGRGNRNLDFASVTATGGNGLFPHITQAIGNSYAHPYLKPDEVKTEWSRYFHGDGGTSSVPLVDHSYLANKALWDEYFFSSVAPQQTGLYDASKRRTAREVAQAAFFEGEPLPNRRLVPYGRNLTEDALDDYFDGGLTNLDGAEELAAHLLVEGPFNVNSASVEAWRALFSSMRRKEVGSLELDDSFASGFRLSSHEPDGTPVALGAMASGEGIEGSPRDPAEPRQWHCWRDLSDEEIDELARAMVRQVKRRGPFLSLSEFVNRRLDRRNKDLSVKGALQAALDDRDVSINAGFRQPDRVFSSAELGRMNPEFPEALEGPVAYGSAPYVDQADILRNFGAQLTPRGDTFLIRTYGDSLDADGKVQARAWCEAVVQRVPAYLNPGADDSHRRQDQLNSEENRQFGRPFRLVSFRWLDSGEV